MKRFSLVLLSVILLVALILGGCAQQTPTSSPATTSTPSSATTSTPSPSPTTTYVLRFAPGNVPPPPMEGGLTTAFVNMIDLLSKKTNGRLKIEAYWGQSLVKAQDVVTGVQTAITDIGLLAPHSEPGKLPLSMIGQLPGIIQGDYWAGQMALWDLMNQEPLLSEYTKYNQRPFTVLMTPDQYVVGRIPFTKVADFKGRKISSKGLVAETLAALGATPVAMSPAEEYEGLKKGITDGIACPLAAATDFKFYEAGKYINDLKLGYRLQPVAINIDSWNKLPADIQKIIIDSQPEIIQLMLNAFIVKGQPLYPISSQIVQANNLEVITPEEATKAEISKIQASQADKWAADQDKVGLQGTKVLTDYRALVAKYLKISTFNK